MAVRLDRNIVRLSEPSRVEDAEDLLALLQSDRGRSVDATASGDLHTAVVQILLAVRPPLAGPCGDPFVERWLRPALHRA